HEGLGHRAQIPARLDSGAAFRHEPSFSLGRSTRILGRPLVPLPLHENSIIIHLMAIAWAKAQLQPPARDHGFHQLRIARVVRETADASSFVLEVPAELEPAFSYEAGNSAR